MSSAFSRLSEFRNQLSWWNCSGLSHRHRGRGLIPSGVEFRNSGRAAKCRGAGPCTGSHGTVPGPQCARRSPGGRRLTQWALGVSPGPGSGCADLSTRPCSVRACRPAGGGGAGPRPGADATAAGLGLPVGRPRAQQSRHSPPLRECPASPATWQAPPVLPTGSMSLEAPGS